MQAKDQVGVGIGIRTKDGVLVITDIIENGAAAKR